MLRNEGSRSSFWCCSAAVPLRAAEQQLLVRSPVLPSEAAGASGALARGLFRAPAQFPAVELAVSKRFSNFDRLGAVTASLGLGLLHCRTTFWTQTFS